MIRKSLGRLVSIYESKKNITWLVSVNMLRKSYAYNPLIILVCVNGLRKMICISYKHIL